MRIRNWGSWLCLLGLAFTLGCGVESDVEVSGTIDADSVETDGADTAAELETPEGGSSLALTPDNTKIQFVGNHTGDDPKPRTCTFQKFSGKLVYADQLEGVAVDIDVDGLETEFEKLTTHLKAVDFFDVKRYPKAAFTSTSIEAGEGNAVTIAGELTMLGQTHEISFPATFDAQSQALSAEFEIDRTKWGMNYDTEKVEPMVEMSINVGS
ncbi:MAG TPA: hypothetical protein DDW52_26845 [Planctomycetaceae bacterium]|nr:hypothetical protein [Planctomycetaceae bacterium]